MLQLLIKSKRLMVDQLEIEHRAASEAHARAQEDHQRAQDAMTKTVVLFANVRSALNHETASLKALKRQLAELLEAEGRDRGPIVRASWLARS